MTPRQFVVLCLCSVFGPMTTATLWKRISLWWRNGGWSNPREGDWDRYAFAYTYFQCDACDCEQNAASPDDGDGITSDEAIDMGWHFEETLDKVTRSWCPTCATKLKTSQET